MSSKLVFAPERANASLATSNIRSRLRCASARGLRSACFERFVGISENPKKILQPETISGYLTYAETLSVLCQARPLVKRQHQSGPARGEKYGTDTRSCK